MNVQFSQHHWLERLSFPHRSSGLDVGITLTWLLLLCSMFRNQEVWGLPLGHFFQNCFGYLVSLEIPYAFLEFSSNFCKKNNIYHLTILNFYSRMQLNCVERAWSFRSRSEVLFGRTEQNLFQGCGSQQEVIRCSPEDLAMSRDISDDHNWGGTLASSVPRPEHPTVHKRSPYHRK